MSRLGGLIIAAVAGLGLGVGLGASGAVDLLADTTTVSADQASYHDCPGGFAMGHLTRGDRVLLTGQDDTGGWLELRAPFDPSARVWIDADVAVPDRSIDALPVRDCTYASSIAVPETATTTSTSLDEAGECAPEWEVDPADGHVVAGQVLVTGSGFTPGSQVKFRLDDQQPFAEIRSDDAGEIAGVVGVPDVAPGEYFLVAEDEFGCLIGRPYEVLEEAATTTTSSTSTSSTTSTTTTTTQATDTTGPTVSNVTWNISEIHESPESGQPSCGPLQVVIIVEVSDPSGVASVEVDFDVGTASGSVDASEGGSAWTAPVGPFGPTTLTGQGNFETIDLTVRATDTAGNESTFSPSGGPVLRNCGTS